MTSRLGPSHFLFFSMLHRRRLWLGHLSRAFRDLSRPTWQGRKQQLDQKFAGLLSRLPPADEELGITSPLDIREYLDDTPVDSFLTTTAERLEAYEAELFTLMAEEASEPDWERHLEKVSTQWGRTLAQESLLSPATRISGQSVRGLFELYQRILEGGEFFWHPLLPRRCTDEELQYELRHCPHRRAGARAGLDAACRLEATVYRSFAQALLPDARLRRIHRAGTCLDEVRLEKTART